MVIFMQGYQHSIPMIRRETKVLGRREEALARAAGSSRLLSNNGCKPKSRPAKVGNHAAVPHPRNFYVRLDNDDLYMLVILKEFRLYMKGHPYPHLVVIQNCKECEWVVHANRYKDEVVLDKGWPAFASFHDLKEGDYVMFKVTADGFKMTIYDRATSCQKVLICDEHAGFD